MYDPDTTIAAVATPPGEGGIGVVRISGPDALAVADRMFRAKSRKKLSDAKGYTAHFGGVYRNEELLDEAVALVFRAPKSYTTEDVAELQCHGGMAAVENVLALALESGAVPAGRGEFTRRAFLGGRISLTEAEGVMSLISAAGREGERAAAALMKGAMHKKIRSVCDGLLAVQAHISASLDFPEEDVEPLDKPAIINELRNAETQINALLDSYAAGAAVLRGIPTVIAGAPNVGKSTIMNLLAGFEKAIVTPTAGTTRDVIEQRVNLDGITLLLADTAGLRDSADDIEAEGVRRARSRLDEASLVLAVFDNSAPLADEDRRFIDALRGREVLAVINKTDLPARLDPGEIERAFKNTVRISAAKPGSLAGLSDAIKRAVGAAELSPDAPLLANERQRACAVRAHAALHEARSAAEDGMTFDVIFDTVEEAISALLELSGEDVTEATLDEVFSKFCVGK